MFLRRYFGKISFLPIGNLVGNNGELVIDEATDKIYIMDGVTLGGHEIANVDALAGNISGDILPWQNATYNIGNSTLQWNNLTVSNTITLSNAALTVSGGNLYIDGNPIIGGGGGSYNQDLNTYNSPTFANLTLTGNAFVGNLINPNAVVGSWGNSRIGANRLQANLIYAENQIYTDGTVAANSIISNSFVVINPANYTGYTFSGYSGLTGVIHANIGNVTTIGLVSNGSASITTYANGYNTIDGYTQFFQNVRVTGNNVTIPTETTIGLLPSFVAANAKLTHVDNVDDYAQFMLQNKSNGSSASGDIVVTADNGSDSTHYIDMGINSSTFSGGGGLDIANDGYLLMEGGNLVVATLTANKDIVFGIGGDAPSNEVARFKSANGFIVNGNITTNGNVIPFGNSVYSLGSLNNQWKSLYVSNNTIYIAGTPVTVANGSLSIGGNTITASSLVNGAYTASLNINGDLYLPAKGGIYPTANDNAGLILYDTNNNNRGQLSAIGDINLRADSANAGVEWTFAANGTTYFPEHKPVSITGNLTVGNLFVTGNSTVINTNSYTVSDNIIQLADQNPADILDLGFVAHRTVNSTLQHTGLVRDASANTWRLFSNITSQPGTTIDFTNAVYDALQLGAISSPTITDIYSNLGAIVGGSVTHANLITTNGLYWANGVSALTSAYGNTQVSAYYVANTVATSNIQILNNGNIRLAGGSKIDESYGAGFLSLIPNTSVNALAGVIIGGSGYLLSPNGSRNAVLNYNAVSGQFGAYILNVYGNQGNAIVNGGSNNYGNIGSISTFFGNTFTANLWVNSIYYPNGTAWSSGSSYGNTQVAAYLPTYTGNIAGNISKSGYTWTFASNGLAVFPNGGLIGAVDSGDPNSFGLKAGSANYAELNYGDDQRIYVDSVSVNIGTNNNSSQYLWTYDKTGNLTLPGVQSPLIDGGYLLNVKGIIGLTASSGANISGFSTINALTITASGNVNATYFNGNGAALTGITSNNIGNIYGTSSNVTIVAGTYQSTFDNVGNVIVPNLYSSGNITVSTSGGIYYSNGTAFSTGGGSTYSNTNVAAYLPTYAGNVNAAFYLGNGYYLTGITGANYSNTNVASYILGNITVGNIVTSGGGQLRGYHIGPIGANGANTASFTTVSATGNITATTANVYAANIVGNTAVYGATFKYSNGAAYDGTYSNSNVASYLPTYTGNVGAGNLIGTSSNVTITAGANVWTFDNTGNLTLPNLSNVYVLGANTNGNINIATLGTGSINLTGNLVANTAGFNIGYLNIPQVAFTANATIAASDSGKHYYSTLSTANTLTISNNSVTNWQVGTSISIVNGGSGTMTIAPASGVSMYLAGNSSSASRTLSSYGMATILNVAANVWYINGSGLA